MYKLRRATKGEGQHKKEGWEVVDSKGRVCNEAFWEDKDKPKAERYREMLEAFYGKPESKV